MPLLTAVDYPEVRAALDVSLTAVDLPDAIIALPIYEPAAEAEVLRRDPAAATRTGTQGQQIHIAAVLLTAALLAPQMPVIVREQDDSTYSVQRQPVDLAALAAQLQQRAIEALAVVLEVDQVTPDRPTFFALASGRRGA